MTNRTAAGRYARALFDVAIAEKRDPERIASELADFVGLVQGHEMLRSALANPAVPMSAKRALVAELATRAGLSPVVSKVLGVMAERDRLTIVSAVLDAYRARLMDYLKIVRADVTTAIPLPADRITALERGLAQATGRRVTVDPRVDPAIIGGVVARIGSVVYDGSIVRHLERIRERLAEV